MRAATLILSLLSAVILTACGDERTRPPSALLTVVNSAPGFALLDVRRGPDRNENSGAPLGSLAYAQALNVNVDSDTYNFFVESVDAATGFATPRAEFQATLTPDQRNFIVLTERDGLLVPLVLPDVPNSISDSGITVTAVHAAEDAPAVDVYLAPDGTDLSTVAPLSTLTFGGYAIAEGQAAGELVLTLTGSGDATNVLFRSIPTTFESGVPVEIMIIPDANGIEGKLSAHIISDASFTLADLNSPAIIRFVNGATDQLPRDIYLGGDFTTAFAAAVPFGTANAYLELPEASSQLSVTPAGNPSVIEAESTSALTRGRRFSFLFSGPAGDLDFVLAADTQIRNNRNASMLIMNAVSYYETLNVYLALPDTDIAAVDPTWAITSPVVTARVPFPAGTFELTVTDAATSTVLHGPTDITLAARGVYSIALMDSGDGTTVTPLLLDDFE